MAGLLRQLAAPALVYNLRKPGRRCSTPRGDSRSNKPQAPQPRSSPAARAMIFSNFLIDGCGRQNRQTHIVAWAAVGSAPRIITKSSFQCGQRCQPRPRGVERGGFRSSVRSASKVNIEVADSAYLPAVGLSARYLNRGRSGDNWRSDRPAQGRRLPRNRVLYPGKANTPTDASSSRSGSELEQSAP